MRSPGAMRHSTSLQHRLSPHETTDTSTRSTTSLPRRDIAICDSATAVAHGRLVGDELVGRVDAELRLGRAGGGAAAQPGELLLHEVLALGLGWRRPSVALDALQDVRRVAALEGLDDAVVHLPRGGADLVEEPPVVGHDHERARVRRPAALEVLGEPGDALDVEVVGGLVEEEDVVVADEQGGERDAAALAAREVADRGLPRDVGGEARDDVADCGVAGPLVLVAVADDRSGATVASPGEVVGLVEHADGDAAAARDAAGVGLEAAGEHATAASTCRRRCGRRCRCGRPRRCRG